MVYILVYFLCDTDRFSTRNMPRFLEFYLIFMEYKRQPASLLPKETKGCKDCIESSDVPTYTGSLSYHIYDWILELLKFLTYTKSPTAQKDTVAAQMHRKCRHHFHSGFLSLVVSSFLSVPCRLW